MNPKETITTNARGGQNSDIGVRYDLIPPLAIKELAQVLEEGAKKYFEWNWIRVDINDHINHALNHTFNFLRNSSVEEISHAFCRLGMALELILRKERELSGT